MPTVVNNRKPYGGRQYEFDGELLTITEIRVKYPAYSESWIREAVKEGCRSLADLRAREYQRQRNQVRSHKHNARTMAIKEARSLKFQPLKSVAADAPPPAKAARKAKGSV